SAAGGRMARGRARDGDDARGRTLARAAIRGAPAALGLGRLVNRARARRPHVRGDAPRRMRLLRLAGDRARKHRTSGDDVARPAHRRRAARGACSVVASVIPTGRGPASALTMSQSTGNRKTREPATHMITPAIAWSSSAETPPIRGAASYAG